MLEIGGVGRNLGGIYTTLVVSEARYVLSIF